MAVHQQKFYEQRVTVLMAPTSGLGWLDMLRYDCCFPATGADSAKLERLQYRDSVRTAEERTVSFIRRSRDPGVETARWASFGCKVLKIDNVSLEG